MGIRKRLIRQSRKREKAKARRATRSLRLEALETRYLLAGNVFAEVLDPLVEPGQEVLVSWLVEKEFVDVDNSGTIEEAEANNIKLVFDALGGVPNQVEAEVQLDDNAYINVNGNLAGIAVITVPLLAAPGSIYDVYVVADNGVDLPVSARSPQSLELLSDSGSTNSAGLSAAAVSSGSGLFSATTTLAQSLHLTGSGSTFQVASTNGFPTNSPFDVNVTSFNGAFVKLKAESISSTSWRVVRILEGPFDASSLTTSGSSQFFVAGSAVRLDAASTYVSEFLGGNDQKLTDYVNTIHGGGPITSAYIRRFLRNEAALTELRGSQAFAAVSGNLEQNLKTALSHAFPSGVVVHGANGNATEWDPTKPTLLLVHGVNTSSSNVQELGSEFKRVLGNASNVMTFHWGKTTIFNGFDKTVGELTADGLSTSGEQRNLFGAINLNKLLRFLDRAYEQAGSDGSTMINIVAHSQGSVVTTAALSLNPTVLSQPTLGVKQTLFIGSNLDSHGLDLFNMPANIRQNITNLSSVYDGTVTLGFGNGLGHTGFAKDFQVAGIASFDANLLDLGIPLLDGQQIRHSRFEALGAIEISWWDWLYTMEERGQFIRLGIQHPNGFEAVARSILGTEAVPLGFPTFPGSEISSPLLPNLDGVNLTGPGATLPPGNSPAIAAPQTANAPPLTVVQGDYFIAEAIGASDPDGFIFRADFFRDLNGNGSPEDAELIGVDFNPGNGWKVAVFTTDWALGTYDILAQVTDNGGNESIVKVADVEVITPGGPPAVLPQNLDNSLQPHYNVVPHRNGDVSYSSDFYALVPGRLDLWQITPQTGGGFSFETTGTTDTVLGLYDWDTGHLIVFDEDNGAGTNAEVTATLTAGKTYVLAVGSQNGSSGGYGLEVTGANQTLTSSLNTPSPFYSATISESISSAFEIDYYELTVPTDATSLNVTLDVAAGVDGWLRIENAFHETVATSFLAGTGKDDVISAVQVTPGEKLYVSVAGLDGTAGNYDLGVDFNPDDSGLPAELTPVPAAAPLVPLPGGSFTLDGQAINSPGQFQFYLVSPRGSDGNNEYTFETFGDVDTQIGIYRRLSGAQAILEATDDDGGGGRNSRVWFTLNGGDDYVVVVRAEGNTTGDFSLQVSNPGDSVGTVTVSGLASAVTTNFVSISNNFRYQHLQVVAPDNATTLTLIGEPHSSSTALDVSLRVADAAGNILAVANAAGPGSAEQITDLAVEAGKTYIVTVYGEDFTTGSARTTFDFNPDFAVGSGQEFPVNSTFFGDQEFPDVARNANSAVAVWQNRDFDRIDAQRFDGNGNPVGNEFQINQTVNIDQPKVGMADNGNFVVLWGTTARVFNASGQAISNEVSTGLTGTFSELAVRDDGSFIVIGGDDVQVTGRIFNASGAAVTGSFVIDDNTTDELNDRSVAADGLGKFIVTWTSISDDGKIVEVYAARLDGAGNIVSSGAHNHVAGRIRGRRFDDVNGSGVQDLGENGVAGVTVLLDGNGNGVQDAGETTRVTDANGDYEFTGVGEGLYRVVSLAGPASGPETLGDNFDRADSTDAGTDWQEVLGDMRIEANAARTQAASTFSRMVYQPFDSVDQAVIFDLNYNATAGNRTATGDILLAYGDETNFLRVLFQDNGGQGGFHQVRFDSGASPFRPWARMSGGDRVAEITPFTSARVIGVYDSTSRTVTVGIDRNFDGTFETIISRGGVLPDGLGTKVGVGGFNNVIIDNFVVDPNLRVVPTAATTPGEEFRVAPGQPTKQFRPSVAAHPDGTFVVAYEGIASDGTGRNIYVQRFNANARPSGELFLAHVNVAGDQTDPNVAVVSQGKFLVAWTGSDSEGQGVRAQQFGVDGSRLGPEFTLNQNELNDQRRPALASDGGERILAVWESTEQDTSGVGIFGVEFSLAEVLEPELTVIDTAGADEDRFIDFGTVAASSQTSAAVAPVQTSITVRNDGNAVLTVTNLEVFGQDASFFQLSDTSGFNLNPGASETRHVTFTAQQSGEFFAAVRFQHNDASDILSGDFDEGHFWISMTAEVPNNPPVVTATANALNYTENDAATPIDGGLTISDMDSATLDSLAVQITAGFLAGQDVLAFTNTALVEGTLNGVGDTLTLSAVSGQTPLLADFQAAARSVTYLNSSNNPNTTLRTITFTADDGAAANNTGADTRNIVVASTTVTTTNDSGQGSLRAAILAANAALGVQTIDFDIAGVGPHTITPLSALPTITDAVIIDGTTQAGFAVGAPVVVLDGINAGNVDGLEITAGGSTVRGLAIHSFDRTGIVLNGAGGNIVEGNFIGTDAAGVSDLGNGSHGISVSNSSSNIIGGTTAAARNVVSGNDGHGVLITGGGATNNVVQGNFIGTTSTGTVALGNATGVRIDGAPTNTIGGSAAGAENVISGQVNDGIFISGTAATGNKIQGNMIGTDVTGTVDLGNGRRGVFISSVSANTIGGVVADEGNVISGNQEHSILIAGSSSTNNMVQGNLIGTDAAGTTTLANSTGVRISGAASNTVGGSAAGAGNVISGNINQGVFISGTIATGNVVKGNLIGVGANGSGDLGNGRHGVHLLNAGSTIIGGTAATEGNVISGNDQHGVFVERVNATNNVVHGNLIGTDSTGATAVGNSVGVRISSAPSNTIGGSASGAGNLISGNNTDGVFISGSTATGNVLRGNLIGVNQAGSGDLGNSRHGVFISGAGSNTVGGTAAGAENVISGNNQHGVFITGAGSTNNLVQGNLIGTDSAGTGNVGNTFSGVRIVTASSNTVGGPTDEAGNVIAFNLGDAVFLTGSSVNNPIRRNSMFSNVGLGIDLGTNGVNSNDPDDPDAGPNNLQNFPVIATALLNGGNIDISYSVPSSTGNSAYPLTVDFYLADGDNQEGRTFLGSDSYAAPGPRMASVSDAAAVIGDHIVATATDANGNTSEFSISQVIGGIQITEIPAYGIDGVIRGTVTGIDPNTHVVAPYIQIEGAGWWTKPTFGSPTVPINPDGTFEADVATGGLDNRATIFFAAVIPQGTSPPQANGTVRVPQALDNIAVATNSVERFSKTIEFAGFTWGVKEAPLPVGPGGNVFSNQPTDVFVDSEGLHLTVNFHDNAWWATEVILLDKLGFGTYSFQTNSELDDLDPNLTFGAFTWDPYGDEESGASVHREIDFEDGRWGNAGDPTNAQMVVQPFGISGNLRRYTIPDLSQDPALTRFFTWEADQIQFVALQGHHDPDSFPAQDVIDQFVYTHDPSSNHFVPTEGQESFRFNLWIFGASAPANGQPVEVIINDFAYAPLDEQAALEAAGGPASRATADSTPLMASQVDPIAAAAIARLAATGTSAADLLTLSSVNFRIADLPDALLGLASGHTITLDTNAAGYGWFIDPTPLDDSEFLSGSGLSTLDSRPSGTDLLTVVMHEMQHLLGHGHTDTADHLMNGDLLTGVRRLPTVDDLDALFGNTHLLDEILG